jgi:transcriptional regulator with XRE-family HTH domain
MPRLSTTEIGKRLGEWCEDTGTTQEALAAQAGLSQPLVSKAIRGDSVSQKSLLRLCEIAGINPNKIELDSSPLLVTVLGEIWDGSEEHADAIAALLLAAKKLARIAPRESRKE